MKRVKKFESIVLDIVSRHPEATNSYALLRFYYLRDHCGLKWLDQKTFKSLMKGFNHLSTLERAYRKLKELGVIRLHQAEQERRERLQKEFAREVKAW